MATNFDLSSSAGSGDGTSSSSTSDSDNIMVSSAFARKLDFSYSHLDSEHLSANLSVVLDRPDDGDGVEKILAYNNRIAGVPDVLR